MTHHFNNSGDFNPDPSYIFKFQNLKNLKFAQFYGLYVHLSSRYKNLLDPIIPSSLDFLSIAMNG